MARCIDEFGGLLWSLARRLSRTHADAEDATQEIFTDIWRSAGRFDPALGSERMFVTMIARRRLIDRLRKVSAEPALVSDEVLESTFEGVSADQAETSIEAEQARRAVAELRPEQRRVLELSLLQGLTQAEISSRLRLPLGTVKTFMRRGLLQVRQAMQAADESPVRGNAP